MTVWLNIVDGKVKDAFGSPQDTDTWPGLVKAQDTDARYLAFLNPTDSTALIAQTRWEHEVAGANIHGVDVFTDRDTQNKLTAAALRATRNPDYSVDWKTSDGSFVNLTAAQIIAIADGVGDYVQACYTREAILLAMLDDGQFTQEALAIGWP